MDSRPATAAAATPAAWAGALLLLVALGAAVQQAWRTAPPPPAARAPAADVFAGRPGELSWVVGQLGGPGNLPGDGTAARIFAPRAVVGGPDGVVFALTGHSSHIRRIDRQGRETELFPQGIALPPGADGVDPGRGLQFTQIALAPDGAFIVASAWDHVVLRIEPDGRARVLAGRLWAPGYRDGAAAASRLNAPEGLAVAGDGTVFVADSLNRAVRRIRPDGRVDTLYRAPPRRDPQRPAPADVALDGDGRLWMLPRWSADAAPLHAVYRLDAAGRIDLVVGAPEEPGAVDGPPAVARLDHPRDLSVDAQGRLWVGEGGTGGAIRRIDADGTVSTVPVVPCRFGVLPCAPLLPLPPEGGLFDAVLAFEGGARVVADRARHALYTLADDGRLLPLRGLAPCAPAADGPREAACLGWIDALAALPDGAVAVLDGPALRRIGRDGQVSTLLAAGSAEFEPLSPAEAASAAAGAAMPALAPSPFTDVVPRLALASDGQGTLFIGIGHAVARRTPDGRLFLASADPIHAIAADGDGPAPPHLEDVQAIARRPDGTLVVADGISGLLRRVDPASGRVETIAGRYGERDHRDGPVSEARFDVPERLALAPDGTLYIGDGTGLRALRPDGQVVTLLGRDADGCASARPEALAVAADGTVWFATRGPPRVWRLRPGGTPEPVAGDRQHEGLRPGPLPGHLAPVNALLPTADGGVLIASGGALLKALPAAPGPEQRAQAGGVPACGRG
jgi:sugar lactone lactonase YvrE